MKVQVLVPLISSALGSLTMATAAQAANRFLNAPLPAPTVAAAPVPVAGTATVISTSKDWQVLDLGTICVAQTSATLDRVNHHLQVQVDKSGATAFELKFKADSATSPLVGFKVTTDKTKSTVYSFAKLSGNGTEETFWNIPRGSDAFVAFLKREMRVDALAVDAAGATKPLAFSLRGSSAALTDLNKKCVSTSTLPSSADMAFEKAFLPQAVAVVDVTKLTPAKTDSLKSLFAQGRTAFLSSTAAQVDLEKLNVRFMKEINELAGLRSNIDRLTQKEVIRLQQARDAAILAMNQADADLKTLRPQVVTQEAALNTANAEYEVAYNAIKPYLGDYDRYEAGIENADRQVSNAESNLGSIDQRIAATTQDIQHLQDEGRQQRHALSSAQSEAQNARFEYDRAARDLRGFDAPSEIRRRQSSDSRIDSLEREARQFDARIQAQQQALAQQESERNRLNAELQQCKATPGADCSAQQQRLVDAQRQFQAIKQGIQQLESNRSSKLAERENIMRSIENDVMRERDNLIRRENDARNQVVQAESKIQQLEGRIRTIEQSEIPSRQQDLNRLNSDRSFAVNDLSRARSQASQARSDMDRFKRGVGFDALQTNLDQKLSRVNSLKNDLARLDREIKKRERTINDSKTKTASLDIEIQKTIDTIKQKELRSIEVQKALAPYEIAKADIVKQKAAADQAFTAAQSQFAAGL